MEKQIVKVLKAEFITHNVKRFTLQKPTGFTFIPGQAADVSLNLPGWESNLHPFTFTSLNEWDNLEFTIKIYPERKGITDQLSQLNVGGELIIHDVFGAINYKGAGVFIAGGAGVTPFIAILRDLQKKGKLSGNKLIFSNKTAEDIILKDEFTNMLGKDFINVLTREQSTGFAGKRIDRNFLIEHISDFSQYFYVCGPDAFVQDITKHLEELGAKADTLVIEK